MVMLLIRRLLHAVGVIWAVATIVFILTNGIGNAAALMLSPDASQEQVDELSAALGFDEPLYLRYFAYIGDLLRGDFGMSTWFRVDVGSVIIEHLLKTMALGGVTIVFAFAVGTILGAIAAARPDGKVDRFVSGFSYVAISMPEFWLGLVLIAIIAVQLGWLPTSGYGNPAHFVLPVLTLMARPAGRIALTVRSSVIEELTHEHIATALAKGVPRRTVLVRHGLRNSFLTAITIAGDEVASIIGGAVVVETIFAWPGVGLLSFQAIINRDLPLVVGLAVTTAAFVLVANLILELLYGLLDPRIRRRN